MNNTSLFFLEIFILFIIVAIDYLFKNSGKLYNNVNNLNRQSIYRSKPLMTACEKSFYLKLLPLESMMNVKIIPQVNLATVIDKISKSPFQNELYRNIDFGIFNGDYKLLLLIEINDSSHLDVKRQKRDKKVKQICQDAGIKLITFYTRYTNTNDYVLSRVKGFIYQEK